MAPKSAAYAAGAPPIVRVYVAGSPEAVSGSRDAIQDLCSRSNVAVVVRDAAGADEALLATSHAPGIAEAYVDLRSGTPPRVVVVDGETRQDLERRTLPEGVSLEISIETMAHVVCAAVESSLAARAAAPPPVVAGVKKSAPAETREPDALPERAPRWQTRASLFASGANFGAGLRAGVGAGFGLNHGHATWHFGAFLSLIGYPAAGVESALWFGLVRAPGCARATPARMAGHARCDGIRRCWWGRGLDSGQRRATAARHELERDHDRARADRVGHARAATAARTRRQHAARVRHRRHSRAPRLCRPDPGRDRVLLSARAGAANGVGGSLALARRRERARRAAELGTPMTRAGLGLLLAVALLPGVAGCEAREIVVFSAAGAGSGGTNAGAGLGGSQIVAGAGGSFGGSLDTAGRDGISTGGSGGGGGDTVDKPCRRTADCDPSWFCQKQDCAAEAGVCLPGPLFEDPHQAPVCGCDHKTYWNDILRQRNGISAILNVGPCSVGALTCINSSDCCTSDDDCALATCSNQLRLRSDCSDCSEPLQRTVLDDTDGLYVNGRQAGRGALSAPRTARLHASPVPDALPGPASACPIPRPALELHLSMICGAFARTQPASGVENSRLKKGSRNLIDLHYSVTQLLREVP